MGLARCQAHRCRMPVSPRRPMLRRQAVAAASVSKRERMRRPLTPLLGAVLVACLTGAAGTGDAVKSLTIRLRAAVIVVDGEAGRPYTAWNGTDPATIVTYTPFTVRRVLKGRLSNSSILLREPGGEVGGVNAAGDASATFVEGERDVVLLGERDPRDDSYPVSMNRGSYLVTRDESGQDGLDIHLGVDAGTYPSREKGSGTPPVRVPLELVERLARGDASAAPAPVRTAVAPTSPAVRPAAPPPAPSPNHRERLTTGIAAVIVLTLSALLVLWRRRARHQQPPSV
jgi:hypothetical protein